MCEHVYICHSELGAQLPGAFAGGLPAFVPAAPMGDVRTKMVQVLTADCLVGTMDPYK